jgi:hypothetical protein
LLALTVVEMGLDTTPCRPECEKSCPFAGCYEFYRSDSPLERARNKGGANQ